MSNPSASAPPSRAPASSGTSCATPSRPTASVESVEWKEGFESQREGWEKEYAEAHARYEQDIAQLKKSAEADAEAAVDGAATNYSSQGGAPAESGGSLASDEQLAALREKLSGGA